MDKMLILDMPISTFYHIHHHLFIQISFAKTAQYYHSSSAKKEKKTTKKKIFDIYEPDQSENLFTPSHNEPNSENQRQYLPFNTFFFEANQGFVNDLFLLFLHSSLFPHAQNY
jgi:hypothetical protein